MFGWDTGRFSFSSETQPSKRREKTRRQRWYFQNQERGLQPWAFLNHVTLCCLWLLWSYSALFASWGWPHGNTWALELRNSTFHRNTYTLSFLPWESGQLAGWTPELLSTPGQSWGRLSDGSGGCLTQHSFVTLVSCWKPEYLEKKEAVLRVSWLT